MRRDAVQYVRRDESGVLTRPDFQELPYSDGASFERELLGILQTSHDLSSASEELSQRVQDWPSEAHLSPARANLLRPFAFHAGQSVLELGAGCGALTRFLGESGARVDAVEGAHLRAQCTAARVRDLPNVTVYCEDLAAFTPSEPYDVVSLVGVLEYARLMVSDPDAIGAYLRSTRKFLKPDGVLLLAIENQLGLKYLNGCHEDHVGRRFAGVCNLYDERTAVTFGRLELARLLAEAGLGRIEWYYPFPDYKVPSIVVAHRGMEHAGFDVGDLLVGEIARDYTGSTLRSFDEAGAWATLHRNGLVPELANSFVAIARADDTSAHNPLDPGGDWLAQKFTAGRRKAFATRTLFLPGADGGVEVIKDRLFPTEPRPPAGPTLTLDHHLGAAAYRAGRLFARDILNTVGRSDDLAHVAAAFTPWLAYLLARSDTRDSAEPWSRWKVSGELLDCTPFNLVVADDGSLCPIDLEFAAQAPIPLAWVVLRGVIHTADKCFGQRALLDVNADALLRAVVRQLGLGDIEDWQSFCALEDELIIQVLRPWPGRGESGHAAHPFAEPGHHHGVELRNTGARAGGSRRAPTYPNVQRPPARGSRTARPSRRAISSRS